MIARFLCATCKAVMDAPVAQAGAKTNCLQCGQRLQIPPLERAKTVLAPSLGVENDQPSTDIAAGTPRNNPTPSAPPPLPPDLQIPTATHASQPMPPPGVDQDQGVPGTVMTAAALLLAYGGLLLFCGCSTLLITATSANRQKQNIFGQPLVNQSRGETILNFVSGTAQFLVSAVMIGSGITSFRRYPVGRWGGLSSLAAQLLMMIISTTLAFLIVNLQQDQGFFPGEGVMAIVLIAQFFPYAIWLAFAVPIGILLNSPSARATFANRPFFGFNLPVGDGHDEEGD